MLVYVELAVHAAEENVLPLHGQWGYWKDWSDCSSSCGEGTQIRSRVCNSPVPKNGGKTCAGPSSISRSCASWPCPDCNKSCGEGGKLEKRCRLCVCSLEEAVLGHIVLADTNFPAAGVRVHVEGIEDVPLATSNATGYFTVTGLCRDQRLVFLSRYHISQLESYEVPRNDSLLVINMFTIELKITKHPLGRTVFTSSSSKRTVELTCAAIAVPPVTHYDWYKDGDLLKAGDPGDLGSSVLVVGNATEKDSGFYACMAVTMGGALMRMSRPGVISIRKYVNDTCDPQPRSNWVQLDKGCHATSESGQRWFGRMDLGQCSRYVCHTIQQAKHSWGRCCDSVQAEKLKIRCDSGLRYWMWRTTQCGCTQCTDDMGGSIMIDGLIRMVNGHSRKSNLEILHSRVNIEVGTEVFYSTLHGRFSVNVYPVADTVPLLFQPYPWEPFMPHVHVVQLSTGRSLYENQLVQLMSRPPPLHLNSFGVLQATTVGESTIDISVLIDPKSVVNRYGETEQGGVLVYVTFHPILGDTGEQTAQGHDLGLDDFGQPILLDSKGLVIISLATETQEVVTVSGNITIKIMSKNPESDWLDNMLWSLDQDTGRWHNPLPLQVISVKSKEGSDESRIWAVEVPVTQGIMIYNIAKRRLRVGQCWLSVNLYQGKEFLAPSTIPYSLSVTSYFPGQTIPREQYTSRPEEMTSRSRVCLPVRCGHMHEISVAHGVEAAASTSHHFPGKYNLRNTKNGKRVLLQSPNASHVNPAGHGPVHLGEYHTCKNSTDGFHVKFRVPPPPPPSQLKITEIEPNMPLSWTRRSTQNKWRDACVVRIRVDTFQPSDVRLVVGSHFRNKDGKPFGHYFTGVEPFYPPGWDSPLPGSHYACTQIRCPEDVYDETTDKWISDVDTYVDIKLLSGDKSCKLLRTRQDDDMERMHVKHDAMFLGYQQIQITETNHSGAAFFLSSVECNENREKDIHWCRHGDPYLFHSLGSGRGGAQLATLNCHQDYSFVTAHFDCTNGKVPLYWKDHTLSTTSG